MSGRTAAVVLAAGGSSRLGRPKQLLSLGGRTLIARAVDVAVEAGCDPVIVVLGRDADACTTALAGRDVRIIVNTDWAAGLGTSIRAGVRAALAGATVMDRVLLLLADQPNVDASTLLRLIAAADGSGRPVTVAAYAGTVGPPVLAGGPFVARLAQWPDDRGAKDLWSANPESVERVDCPEAATDVDTEADYVRLREA